MSDYNFAKNLMSEDEYDEASSRDLEQQFYGEKLKPNLNIQKPKTEHLEKNESSENNINEEKKSKTIIDINEDDDIIESKDIKKGNEMNFKYKKKFKVEKHKKGNKGHKSKIKASSTDDTQKTQINFKNYQHENLFNTESFMDMNALDDDKFEGKEGFFPDIDEEEAQPEELPPNNNMMDITNEESVFTIRLEENLN
jgi:hypothetical protein